MTIENRLSLRKCINDNCKTCIYDPKAAGTWRQQVTLCSVTSCALYPVRPATKAPIPHSVLNYYAVPKAENPIYGCSRLSEGCLTEHSDSEEYQTEVAVEDGPNHGDTR